MCNNAHDKKDLSEFDLIREYFSCSSSQSMVLGSGDDCAIYEVPAGHNLVFSIDTVVEGRHFPSGLEARHIATRALGAALSDLAAMGAKPSHFTLALSLPSADSKWLKSFSDSLYEFANQHQIVLVGGDTTKGPLVITIQVHGLLPKGLGLARSGAQPGDAIFVSGALGDAKAGLELCLKKDGMKSAKATRLIDKFYCPNPQLELGQTMLGRGNACIDVSDGLVADIRHIARQSGLQAHVNVEAVPLSTDLLDVFPEQALNFALGGGDDYQLIFAVPAKEQAFAERLGLTQIGRFKALDDKEDFPNEVVLKQRGREISSDPYGGYQHFTAQK